MLWVQIDIFDQYRKSQGSVIPNLGGNSLCAEVNHNTYMNVLHMLCTLRRAHAN